jgi:aryl-alcohol dehydrogenase-like predicted oxidoreductase
LSTWSGRISDESTQQRIQAHRDQLEAYEGLCRKLGAKPAEVALAWLLPNPVVSTMIVGATTIEELQWDLGACRCSWTPRSWNGSDRIWPGPRGKPSRRTPGKADRPVPATGLLLA